MSNWQSQPLGSVLSAVRGCFPTAPSQPYLPPQPRGQQRSMAAVFPVGALWGLHTLACWWSFPSIQSDSYLPLGLCSSFSPPPCPLSPRALSPSGTGHLIVPRLPSPPGFASAAPSALNALLMFACASPQSPFEVEPHPELSQSPPVPPHSKSKIPLPLPFAKVCWLSVSPTRAVWHFSQPASYLPARTDAYVRPHLHSCDRARQRKAPVPAGCTAAGAQFTHVDLKELRSRRGNGV